MNPEIDYLQRQLLLRPYEVRNWHRLETLVLQRTEEADGNSTTGRGIHWGSLHSHQEQPDKIFPPLKNLFYDGSCLTPLIGNLYHREPSETGWIRWVGPEPKLTIRFPFENGVKAWRFEVVIARFFDQSDDRFLRFNVNGTDLPLLWAEGNTYWSEVEGRVVDEARRKDPAMGFSTLEISIPSSHRPEGEDQRMLAFAISQISMHSLKS